MKNPRTFRAGAAYLVVLLTLAGCAGSSARAPEQLVAERAKARWQSLINRDFNAAWEFLTPGLRRTTAQNDYSAAMTLRPVTWTSASVKEVSCPAEDLCRVRVEVELLAPVKGAEKGVGMFSGVSETWLRMGGRWYFSPES